MRKNNALSIYEEIGDAFNDLFPTNFNQMKSDIKETDSNFLIDVEMPGFKKEEVKVSVNDGYLTIKASKNEEKEEKAKFIRRERTTSVLERSYYIGDIEAKNIKAKMENGVLHLELPKQKEKEDNAKHILIE